MLSEDFSSRLDPILGCRDIRLYLLFVTGDLLDQLLFRLIHLLIILYDEIGAQIVDLTHVRKNDPSRRPAGA